MKFTFKHIRTSLKPNGLQSVLKVGVVAILLALVVTGCKVGDPYQRPEFEDVSADYYQASDSLQTDTIAAKMAMNDSILLSSIPWKQYIKDTLLTSLIDTALVRNIDLNKALQNMQIGLEQLEQSKANLYPSLNSNPAGFRRDYYSQNYNNYGSNRARRNHSEEDVPTSLYTERLEYTMALESSWEADIWGKLRWKKESARAQYMKTQEFKKAVQTALIAEVSSTYYNLLMLKAQLAVAQQNFQLNDSTLRIVRLQYDAGETTSLAMRQTQSQMLKSKSLIPQLEREYTIMENRLNSLLGRSPRPIEINKQLGDVNFQQEYGTGVPLDLIRNRPDVAISEYELISSNAQVGVAEAMKYPSLTISASAGLNSYQLKNLLDPVNSGFALLNGALFQPIFNNRKLKTNYRVAMAQREIAQLNFKDKLIDAVGDVSNALATIDKLEEEYEIAQDRIVVTRQGLKDAALLFKSGFANYLEVITAQSDALESELYLIQIKKQILIANIELYRSLGGGWK
ncbi:efflux transporter, outer membrane factor (OMF) lipoprotein, NodT family [Pustulibacterium marinum]|uniref:Efflux transporter, outer membrane factor (OMF) lipoprotein, NodT family n=1 Tax=Pustulibacterium marinum TaxID=1224947 RepID=A0A1I7HXS6_9FLAO|nr:efflux transporter outer membrane subunit [Pustulibacterium marinum]SFU65459.1 efflux transporter, outer membrane factor (OMF) lipoprotein, NodT family [Pustulibacterium marinum]